MSRALKTVGTILGTVALVAGTIATAGLGGPAAALIAGKVAGVAAVASPMPKIELAALERKGNDLGENAQRNWNRPGNGRLSRWRDCDSRDRGRGCGRTGRESWSDSGGGLAYAEPHARGVPEGRS